VIEEAVKATKRYYGYFCLSNKKRDAMTALELYRNKNLIERAFDNIKVRLNLNRLLVSSVKNLDGKILIAFIALTYFFFSQKNMQEVGLYQN